MATSSGVARFTGLSENSPPPSESSEPNPANRTFASERFMASVIWKVRISPAAPTSAPPMIRGFDSMTNPAADAASPEKELRREMTTGMSAPPMGITERIPMIRAMPPTTQYPGALPVTPDQIASAIRLIPMIPLTHCCPG